MPNVAYPYIQSISSMIYPIPKPIPSLEMQQKMRYSMQTFYWNIHWQ